MGWMWVSTTLCSPLTFLKGYKCYLMPHKMVHVRCPNFNNFKAKWAKQVLCVFMNGSEVFFHI